MCWKSGCTGLSQSIIRWPAPEPKWGYA